MDGGTVIPERSFPVMRPWIHRGRDPQYPDCPASIPWSAIAPHEPRALRNHQQSLERLAARGGLDPVEIAWVVRDQRWGTDYGEPDLMRSAVDLVKSLAGVNH